jgi:hypothetical protein
MSAALKSNIVESLLFKTIRGKREYYKKAEICNKITQQNIEKCSHRCFYCYGKVKFRESL